MPINHKKNQCHEVVSHSVIQLRDKGSPVKLDIENLDRSDYLKTRVDSAYIQNETACDYMLSCCETKRSLLVELKGNNTSKGCDQLMSTYTRLKKEGVFKDNGVPAVLVGSQVRPKANPTVMRKKVEYSRLAKKHLHVYNKQRKAPFSSFF